MKKITIWMSVVVVAAIAILPAQGGTYTWLATPADGNWNTSSLNWSDGTTDGVAWVDDASNPNDAVFGTTSTKSVSIGSRRTVNNLTFTGNEYSLSGNGPLAVAGSVILNTGSTFFRNVLTSGREDGSLHFSASSTWKIAYVYGTANTQTSTYLDGSVLFAPSNDRALGVVPATRTENIFITGTPTFFASGNFAINSNRTIKVLSGKGFDTGVNGGPFTYKCRVFAENSPGRDYSTNTYLNVSPNWTGLVVFDPGAGVTNAFGRLQVNARVKILSGVTYLTGPGGTGTSAFLYVSGGSTLTDFSSTKGNLTIDGSEVYTSQSSYVDLRYYGQVTVTNGGKLYMPSVHWLNGHGSPGRLTIADGGEVTLSNLRISQSSKSEVHLNEGGLLKTLVLSIDPAGTQKGTFWFNGGRLQSRDARRAFFATASATPMTEEKASGIRFAVGEKGAVFDTSNGVNLWWNRPLVSGVEQDGGLRKLGAASGENILILMTTNRYNGVTSIEGGGVQLRADNALPPGTTVRMSGVNPYLDAYTFDTTSPSRSTEQWLSRVEGSGDLRSCSQLHVTNSLAPSVNGVLAFANPCDLRGDYEIVGNSNTCSRLYFKGKQDISGLTLKVSDFSTFDTRAPNTRYAILVANAGYTGKFVLPADWPKGWDVKYTDAAAYLYFQKGTAFIVR